MSTLPACYRPDGTISDDIPCGFSPISQCCGEGWDCLLNGLCRDHGTAAYSQGSCTDPSFKKCLAFCDDYRFKGFTRVSHCDKNGNSWCCAGAAGQVLDGADCCLSNETTSLQPYPLSTLDPPANSKTVIVTKTVLISLYLTGAPKFTSSSVDPNRLPAFLTSQTISWKSIIVHSSSVSSHCSTIVPSISVSSQGSTTVRSSSVSSYCSTIVRCSVSSQNSTTVPSSLISSLCPIIVASSSVSSRPLGQNHISSLGIEIGVPLAVMIVVLLVSFAFYIFRKQKLRRREVAELEGRAAWELDAPHNESCYAPRYELG